jgi:perosamine synthetase
MMELFDTIITEEARKEAIRCLDSGRLSEGGRVAQFENALRLLFGYGNGLAVNSCTAALHLALLCAGVGKGDEVILPAQTFVATGMAILYCGATPIFADINTNDGNISVDSVSSKITERTKAVICVSWGGNPCNLKELQELCMEYTLELIQDNAQALGARYEGQPLTYYGDFSCFSFQATKHLTTGDGGLLVCTSGLDYEYAKGLRWFGINREHDLPDKTGERSYNLEYVGYKYHMNDLSASLGFGNLDGIHTRLMNRAMVAKIYDLEISWKYKTIRKKHSANWIYTLLVDRRDDFIRMMNSKGIPVSVVHNGIDRNVLFGGKQEELVNQRYWDEHHVCLPCHSSLVHDDIYKITEAISHGW